MRYDAPAGEVITAVSLPYVNYFDGYLPPVVDIADAAGNVVASASRITVGPEEIFGTVATGLNTSSVEIRFGQIGGGVWGARFWPGNYVALGSVEVTTAPIPEPATMGLLGLGILGLLRRKRA